MIITAFHLISEDGLPKKEGAYFVIHKDGNGDTLNFVNSLGDVHVLPAEDDDRAGFIDVMYDDQYIPYGLKEVTNDISAWAEIPSVEQSNN